MKVILLKDVPKVGQRFSTVEVAEGYALNFLLPRGLAKPAVSGAAKELIKKKEGMDRTRAATASNRDERVTLLDGVAVTLSEKANEKGHLFAAVPLSEILTAVLQQHGIELSPEDVGEHEPVKSTGVHHIPLRGARAAGTLLVTIEAKK